MRPELLSVEEALSAVLGAAPHALPVQQLRPPDRVVSTAADGLAIVPESVEALPAGAPVELWWLDRP